MATSLTKFDPEEHNGSAYEAFLEFLDSIYYEYDAIAKDPPKEQETVAQKAAWIEQNKRKIFLGKFASKNLQREYEEVTTSAKRTTMTYADMATKLTAHLKAGSNTTLANFQFNKLSQKADESFDSFTIRVKREARKCDFSCANANCTVTDTLARDQIIIGVTSNEIRQHALKNQWNLTDLISNGRRLEAANIGVERIKHNSSLADMSRVKRPGKYSRKSEHAYIDNKRKESCITYSSKTC